MFLEELNLLDHELSRLPWEGPGSGSFSSHWRGRMKGIHFGKQNHEVLQTEKELWVKTERVQNQGSGCGPEEERTHY